jgi:large subunit ribosomal protein L28
MESAAEPIFFELNLRRVLIMSRRCELTGKGPIVKNNVSHSHIKTKKWVTPNIKKRRMYSDTLGGYVTLRVATRTMRAIEHVGGFDKFILRQSKDDLSKRARTIRARISKARRA